MKSIRILLSLGPLLFSTHVHAQDSSHTNVNYGKLASPAFLDDFVGTKVAFTATFLGQWNLTQVYEAQGIETRDRVFLNHRQPAYQTSQTPFGSSDGMMPPFALSLSKAGSEIVFSLNYGQTIKVVGRAIKSQARYGGGLAFLHILADVVTPVGAATSTEEDASPEEVLPVEGGQSSAQTTKSSSGSTGAGPADELLKDLECTPIAGPIPTNAPICAPSASFIAPPGSGTDSADVICGEVAKSATDCLATGTTVNQTIVQAGGN